MRFLQSWVLGCVFGLFLSSFLWAACPPKEKITQDLLKVFPRLKTVQIQKIRPSKVPGFCEVVLTLRGRKKSIFYVDENGRFAFLGQLVDFKTGENLTRKHLEELNRLSLKDLAAIEKVVAFTTGEGKKVVYLVTDPDCPFCKRLEKTLSELIKGGQLQVKVILYPLGLLHPQAKKKCVAIICDKKGWEGLISGYISENQCEEGLKKIEETRKLMVQLGIRGTPTLILPDGRVIRGARSKEELKQKIGLK